MPPRRARAFRPRMLPLLLLVAGAIAACQDRPTAPSGRARVPVADSLLMVSLVGPHTYADSTTVEWREAWGASRVRSVRVGAVDPVASWPLTLSWRRNGVDSSWLDTTDRVSLVSADSFPGVIWLDGDTLRGLWPPRAVPRTAISDSGLHYSTADLASPGCQAQRMLWVPDDATEIRCQVAVHWRPVSMPAR